MEVIVSMLMRFDPFREIDRVFDQALTTTRMTSMPMDAYRHGESFVVHLDLPGVDPGSIDVSAEQNVLTISAERHWQPVEGDQVVANERPQGRFTRQLFLGNALDAEGIHATYDAGVLTLTLPKSEKVKPRRIAVKGATEYPAVTAQAERDNPKHHRRAAMTDLKTMPDQGQTTVQRDEPKGNPAGVFAPRIDLLETEDAFWLKADLPGVKPDGVSLHCKEGELVLHARREARYHGKRLVGWEFAPGDYFRAFTLGEQVDCEAIDADLKNGVLTLKLPKAEAVKPRKIAVKGG